MKGIASAVTVAALAVAVTACSPSAGPPQGGVCPQIAEVGPPLLFPIPGATGVPTTAGNLIFAAPSLSDFVTSLVPAPPAFGAPPPPVPAGAFGAPPSPLPGPSATAPPGDEIFAAAYPALSANTTYAVTFAPLRGTGTCTIPVGSSGSFTTAGR